MKEEHPAFQLVANILLDEADKITLPLPDPDISGFIATALRINEPVTMAQKVRRYLFPFRKARLRRNVRAWLPVACKEGPRSIEWEMVADWSWELRSRFGL